MGCLVLKETRVNLDHLDLKESEANRQATFLAQQWYGTMLILTGNGRPERISRSPRSTR